MSDIFKAKVNNQWVGIPSLTGERGPQGPQGATGATGDAAGINSATATVTELGRNDSPTVSASVSGPDTAKDFAFAFGFPKLPKVYTVTVNANNWTLDSSTGKYTNTITWSIMTADTIVMIGAKPDSMDEINDKGIYCSGQGAGYLEFSAYTQPSATVYFGAYIV